MVKDIPRIPVATYCFNFFTGQQPHLPRFPGSAWRGAFGHALKKTVCVVRNTPCNQCMLRSSCAYTYLFETPPPSDTEKMRKYNTVPHPFVMRFPDTTAADSHCFSLIITLFGHGQRYFPYIVHTLQKAGQDGIGGQRQAYQLQTIDEISLEGIPATIYNNGELKAQNRAKAPVAPSLPKTVEIVIHAPLRIKQDGRNVTPPDFGFAAFFNTLLRRISLISYFHTDTPLETDFAWLSRQSKAVELVSSRLEWYDWTRYSSRQQTEMNMGGLIGTFEIATENLEAFWPYSAGQWTHVGKGTSMGMGAYSINATSLPTWEKARQPMIIGE